jgi:metal-responsive CopG/Arc/MetJ family transcriptional regulator
MAQKAEKMTELVGVRFTAEAISEIEEWRRQQSVIPSRTDAIRDLVREGIASYRRKADARAKDKKR